MPKRPSHLQLQEAKKKKKKNKKNTSDRAITPEAEAVHVPTRLAPPGSLQAKQLHHPHTQLSLGKSFHRQKKFSCLCTQGCFGCVQLSVTLWTMACRVSLLECSPGKNTGVYWHTGCHTLPEHYISCCPSCQLT